jgi:hypothetical protein
LSLSQELAKVLRVTIQDNPDQSCEAVDAIARAQLGEIERRIDILLTLKAELERMIEDCSGGRVAECRVIEALANHSKRQVGRRAATAT